ncbi:M48 family metalloprotease [Allosaccharopolyspora coralli]|uniref:M48 family metalloprotease n=1 Tax=Allosaccharopolyspora coralli TaxID=2665642 RepID=A0A5Q3Q762_9PSEU|nr:M56 family metallopeptidase [Allosaccharopolyspora coralli]QGK70173.1 M48 family metalloprotease [Allosaccharopolyspora coralli]
MTIAIGLLVGAMVVAVFGPVYLRALLHPRVRPGIALAGWVASPLVAIGAAVAGASLLLVPHNESVDGLIGMAQSCINVVHGDTAAWEYLARLCGAALVAGAALRVLTVTVGLVRKDVATRRRHLTSVRLLSRADPDSAVLWLDQAVPVAYSMGGRRGAIVATTGVDRLDGEVRDAVLAHERAHLSGRHHGLVLFVTALAKALPFVPLFRAASPAVRLLVELAADARAARHCGAGSVCAALCAVTGEATPATSLAMSRESVRLRLHWLQAAPAFGRHRARYVAAVLASATPAIVAVGAAACLVLLYCFALKVL